MGTKTPFAVCPNCGGQDFSEYWSGVITKTEDEMLRTMFCDSCRFMWKEIYKYDRTILDMNKES